MVAFVASDGNDVEAGKGVIAGVPMLLFTRIQWEFLGRSLKYRLHQSAGALVHKPSSVSKRGESSTLISLPDYFDIVLSAVIRN